MDSSEVKGTFCSAENKGLLLGTYMMALKPSEIPVPEEPMPSSDPTGTKPVCASHTYKLNNHI